MNVVDELVDWVKSWDLMAILYSLIGSVGFALLLKWIGVFRWVRRRYKFRAGIRAYRKELTVECETLIVVGRRRGFKIDDVFIPLDLVPSDLMGAQQEKGHTPSGAYVLVGGPGAGKSTLAKKRTLERVHRDQGAPFFVRLREYSGFNRIEDCLVEKLRSSGVPEPEIVVQDQLSNHYCLCVLDGLDEVRPHLRNKVCDDINKFYARHFCREESKTLIVTCRKEAYRDLPLDIPEIWEVRPLTDEQVQRFAAKWPLGYPSAKDKDTFWRDLTATPRILELARSPLLLVGGLMQYTESNLGIPDERFEYLARVARWLVSDWATAQGHPPDPLRPVYDKVLSRMGFHLHSSETSECPLKEAKALVESWLPNLGLEGSKATEVLQSIATRTGILVSEGDNTFIFAQFGLQEYFASLELLERLGAEEVAKLQPKSWWREVILLAVAQLREPSCLLESLFAEDPLLAAAAVAECPTPPTGMQEKAIEACLKGIDNKDKAATGAVVPLLRKVTAFQEQNLCAALEKRLNGGEEVASLVGRCLATAGTAAATDVLRRYPEVWSRCLSEAGYLSASFENMLVEWIREGDEQQSRRAAELISTRLSNDRFVELVDLLPSLSKVRAERLAALLLRHVEEMGGPEFYGHRGVHTLFIVWVVSCCSACIRDREGHLKERESRLAERKEDYRARYYYPGSELGDIVSTALFLERKGVRLSGQQIFDFLANSIYWARSRGRLLCLACGGLLALAVILGPVSKAVLTIPTVLVAGFFATYPVGRLPWFPRRFFGVGGNIVTSVLMLLVGACAALSLSAYDRWLLNARVDVISQMGVALCCCLVGLARRSYGYRWGYLHEGFAAPPERGRIRLPVWVDGLYCGLLLLGIVWVLFLPAHGISLSIVALVSGGFLMGVIYLDVRLTYCHRIVQKAAHRAGKVISRIRP